ncbi:HTH-type transcriptional regulator CatM [Paraglaciecola mesophila]|uniref:HTH-type transcriptional regulator CatM n=1 Tax=Paraglaciecola mesophila TaxID=197222 RepID=A0A857JKS1_9ALTE|nr:LysR family transcriptional regulator [Paraglaciecola mesophila]QHJ12669.1 HTH-type transcriptional regulator CatM [Paraglaciecola mesophila]
MDIEDLRKIVHVAKTQNLQHSAKALFTSAGALSKIVKKTETSLNTQLFDRIGRNIKLNEQGRIFVLHAANLVHDSDQLLSHFAAKQTRHSVQIGGPSIIQDYWLEQILPNVVCQQFYINVDNCYEGEALTKVKHGLVQLGFVTGEALHNVEDSEVQRIHLARVHFALAISAQHADYIELVNELTLEKFTRLAFACPKNSAFCGLQRGVGSDGWRDDQLPRNIQFRFNDLHPLLAMVKRGAAAAYLPEYVIQHEGLKTLGRGQFQQKITRPFEDIYLIWKPTFAPGWLNGLLEKITANLASSQ